MTVNASYPFLIEHLKYLTPTYHYLPLMQTKLWLVDAASQWSILDKYQLDDYEHGTAMSVLYLTDVSTSCHPFATHVPCDVYLLYRDLFLGR